MSASSPSVAPELLYVGYNLAFPFIAYYLFDVVHKHQRKEWATKIMCFGLLMGILYSWMFVLGPRVYIFLYPIMCVAGIVPILKLLAFELNCLSSDMSSHIRSSFWNYYIYLVTPSEVVFDPKGKDVLGITKRRFVQGLAHLVLLLALNNLVLFAHIDQYRILREAAVALQLALCFCTVSDLSLAAFGVFTHDKLFLEDIFYKPYFAESPKEFWSKRWNLVVHKYICKLLYFPLGGRKNQVVLLPLIFLTVGVCHEIPMLFLPSAKLGYWTLLFAVNVLALFAQSFFEKSFPHLKCDPTTKNIMRAGMVALLVYTSAMAYKGFGMTAEIMASDFNRVVEYPMKALLYAS